MSASIEGDAERLAKALGEAEQRFKPFGTRAMVRCLLAVQRVMGAPYPPQPDRMRSGRLNRYVRGIGTYPKEAFTPDVKQPGGFAVKRMKGINKTSQQMDKRWKIEGVKATESGIEGHLKNIASYSGWVIGPKEDQMPYHALTGWPNQDDGMVQAQPAIDAEIEAAVDEYIKSIVGA